MSHLGATADLLKVARDTLREAVAPGLGAEARYHAAMVANAMAIAIREVELGPKTRAAERRLLGGFYAGRRGDAAGAARPAMPGTARRRRPR